MKTNPLATKYAKLTPEERFRLIVAAGARGDELESDRLLKSGERIVLSLPDHAPYSHALHEVSDLTYLEILDAAAFFLETFEHAADSRAWDDQEEDIDEDQSEPDEPPSQDEKTPVWQRHDAIARAASYLLRTKVDGWKLFLERLSIPPFALWQELPGFGRLKRTLDLAAHDAIAAEEFVRWFKQTSPVDDAMESATPLTAERFADSLDKLFRHRVKWWSG